MAEFVQPEKGILFIVKDFKETIPQLLLKCVYRLGTFQLIH